MTTKLTLVRPVMFGLTLLLVACGGKPLAPGKEAAAGALFQASRGANSVPGGLLGLYEQRVAPNIEIKVSCPKGGNFRYVLNTSGTGNEVAFNLVYDGCSFNGRTSMRGTMTMSMVVVESSQGATLGLNLRGRVDFSGEISDFVESDVTQTVSINDLGTPTQSVSIILDGWIRTSSGTYTYNQETLIIDGSDLKPAPDPS
jgi:hypothetical protein